MSPGPGATGPAWRRPLLSLLAITAAVGLAMVTLNPSRPQPVTVPSPTPTLLSPAEQYTRAALQVIEEHGLLLDETAWPGIVRDTMLAVAAARSPTDTYSAISTALARATGPGGLLVPRPDARAPRAARPVEVSVAAGIGRITVPSVEELAPGAASRRAAETSDAIEHVQPGVSCGWVVDVRATMSDTDWGALAGLAAFSHAGEVFGLRDGHGKTYHVSLALGAAFLDGEELASSGRSPATNTQPVAVLQSASTTGAGEALILALHRGARARTFGSQTRGAPITETFSLADGAQLVIPTTRLVDVGGWAYTPGVAPMVRTVTPEQAAVAWLRSQCR
jgi:hypothetical protein